MSTRLQQRRARLKAEYGFDFPDDFYKFWEFANKLSPLDPLQSLSALDFALVGPFEILSGRFDGRVPKRSLLLHWRYHDDPPEFFTVFAGGGDGLHYGYFLDDPDAGEGCVSSYFARDAAYELSADGDTLFEAVRLHLEYLHADFELDFGYNLIGRDERDHGLEELAQLRSRLTEYATTDRPETGEAYTEQHAGVSGRNDRVIAETREGMGIVAKAELYRPLSLDGRALTKQLFKKKTNIAPLVEEARQALRDGFPATALQLGKNLWATGDVRKSEVAAELLDAAYDALGRESLRRVLQTHHAHRELPSVDVLENE
jgi:hypothetical protein